MAITLTIGLQKGGISKTTSTAVTAFLFSLMGYRTLMVDMDTQGNLTEMFLQEDLGELYDDDQVDGTIREALEQQNPKPYLLRIQDNLDLLGASDHLASFTKDVYVESFFKKYEGREALILRDTLSVVDQDYDLICIDTPPSLSILTVSALAASDYVVPVVECSKFAKTALKRFFETIEYTQEEHNPNLKIFGILPTMIDQRRTDAQVILELIREDPKFGPYVLPYIIKRKASTGRLPIYGFDQEMNKELKSATDPYIPFVKELMERVQNVTV
ncbi:cobyric acid synthase [Marinithermofilum abyssi]|uniref:Cobyric acid synthase n=1 Tax=Marinithermofilum abyssi TaxID=1571185 RepID=A0A8J2VM43_9BACL|nr:ParA family protein [Marinithermofilum abyssi]GGE28198.1 cobyric acid synthase [Marinithermofilum abyssi]